MNNRVGQQFGNYRLIRLLGQGSFAEVYLGEHIYLKTSAAVKLLRRSLTDEDAERFLAEARTLARLRHPYIVSVLDFDMEQTMPVLVMQYAPRGTLRQRFHDGSRLSLETTVMYVKQAAEALQYAHRRGVIHRDIKPDNMLLISDRTLLVSDFGIALLAPSPTLLSTQAMAGTPSYTAPEQLRGKPTFASDQYSLAVVAYEWLCGVRPFEGARWEIVQKHMFATPLPLRAHNPDIPVAVEAVVLKALTKDPRQRFVDMRTFAEAFEQACLGNLPRVNGDQEDTQPLLATPPRVVPTVPVLEDQPEHFSSEPQLSHRIFLTASPADAPFAAGLMKDLRLHGIESSNDNVSTIAPGVNQEDVLRTAMRSSSCVLVVISPHTRSSRIIGEHLRMAGMYQRRLVFVWAAGEGLIQVLLEAAGYGVDVDVIDARETRYSAAIDEIVASINKDTRALSPQKPLQPLQEARNPYKGLQAFTERDVKDFFGRTALVEELVKSLQHTLNRGRARLLAVVGPSGSGKSSVVRAGLLPQLQGGALPGSARWIYLDPVVPEKRPIESLALALEPHLQHKSIKTIREDLRDDSLRGLHLLATRLLQSQNNNSTRDDSQRGLHRLPTRLVRPQGARVVLLIDQFEEIFSQSVAEQERQQMIDLLLTAATEPGGPVVLLLTLRADFYDRPMRYPALSRLLQEHTIPVLPMDLQELRAVIEEPAALPDVQLNFEGNLVGDLLFETYGQAGALPLLEFTLDELFRQRAGHWITQRAYEQMGGVKGALAKHAESTYASLPSDEHRSFAQVLFVRLINLGVTDQDTTRRRAALSELSLTDAKQTALLREVTDAFIEARLLTTSEHAGVTTVEVSHEALIREWARLSDWLREGREDISFQQSISGDVDTWEQRGRPRDRLYHGSQLKEAKAWARRNKPSEQETAFLRASMFRQMRYVVSVIVIFLLLFTSAGAAIGFYLLIPPPPPDPARVTNLHDDGLGSLRSAIKLVRPGSTIRFASDVRGTISLTSGDLVFAQNLIIQGPGASALTISGGSTGSVVRVLNGKSVTISGLSFKDSNTEKVGNGFLYNEGTLKLVNTTISGNTSSGLGGGIYSANGSALTLINSTVSNNSAQYGGGIYNDNGVLNVTSSTISGNKAVAQDDSKGGGIYAFGPLILTNSTVSGNVAFDTGGGITVDRNQASITFCTIYDNTARSGGGLSIENTLKRQSHVEMADSIVAGNHAPVGADVAGTLTSGGYNLILDVSQAYGNFAPTDLIDMPPDVGPLRNNDGLTETHALAPDSPAIDRVPPEACRSDAILNSSSKTYTDQRGVTRPRGAACDIGAYEK
jgi:serine/threonine protein kinase